MNTPPTFFARTKRYWTVNLSVNAFIETELLLLTFAAGLQNAVCFSEFHAFTTAQTGNTVVLAISMANGRRSSTCLDIGTSLTAWLAGVMITGRLGNVAGRQRRVWQVGAGLVQTCMVFGSCFIQWKYGIGSHDSRGDICLALLAFSCGSQVAAGRVWDITEISNATATACWMELLIDERLFARDNKPRTRRALSLATLISGTVMGAFAKDWLGSAEVIMFSGVIKVLVVLAMCFNPGEQTDELDKPL